MIKTLIIALLISFSSIAQDLDYIKSEDTLYLVMPKFGKHTPSAELFENFNLLASSNGFQTQYYLEDRDTLSQKVVITIRENPTMPIEGLPVSVKRKKFLKKNKKRILSFDFIKKYKIENLFMGYLDASPSRQSRKIIYVIDEESLKRKDKNIILRKADIVTHGFSRI